MLLLLLLFLQGEGGFGSEKEKRGYCDKANEAEGYDGEGAFQADSPRNGRRHCFRVYVLCVSVSVVWWNEGKVRGTESESERVGKSGCSQDENKVVKKRKKKTKGQKPIKSNELIP